MGEATGEDAMKKRKPKIPVEPKEYGESFDDRFAWVLSVSKDICQKDGDLRGRVLGFDQADHVHMLVNMIDHHNHTAIFAANVRRHFRTHKVREYYFVATGWTVPVKSYERMKWAQVEAAGHRRELHLHPERQEILMVLGVRGEQKRSSLFYIHRDAEENITSFEAIGEINDASAMFGRFSSLLDPLEGH